MASRFLSLSLEGGVDLIELTGRFHNEKIDISYSILLKLLPNRQSSESLEREDGVEGAIHKIRTDFLNNCSFYKMTSVRFIISDFKP